ncbi:MAG: response regulator [Nitrospinae bacterium]|nr:response regulator [Nitrospinota bacterium]
MAKKKIMVVDDDPDMIYTVKHGLEHLTSDYEFLEVGSGSDCIKLLEKGEKPDLILLDIMMPGMNGWEVATKLKSNPLWKKIPFVFLTAKTDDMSKGMGSLASEDYICKPFDISELKKRIEKIIEIGITP